MEPDIVPDSLQRLHILHNVELIINTLQQKGNEENSDVFKACKSGSWFSGNNAEDTIKKMKEERDNLESHYIEAARVLQLASQSRLKEAAKKRTNLQKELYQVNKGSTNQILDQPWWEDLLAWCHLHPNRKLQDSLSDYVEQSLFELFNDPSQPFRGRSFPVVQSLDGLHISLNMRLQGNTFFSQIASNFSGGGILKCIQSISNLSDHPSNAEIFENSHALVVS